MTEIAPDDHVGITEIFIRRQYPKWYQYFARKKAISSFRKMVEYLDLKPESFKRVTQHIQGVMGYGEEDREAMLERVCTEEFGKYVSQFGQEHIEELALGMAYTLGGTRDPSLYEEVSDLVESYKSKPAVAAFMAFELGSAAWTFTYAPLCKEYYEELIPLFKNERAKKIIEDSNPDAALAIARGLVYIHRGQIDLEEKLGSFLDVLSAWNPENLDASAIEEFSSAVSHDYISFGEVHDIVCREKEFFRDQGPQTAYPVAAVMSGLDKEYGSGYSDMIKDLDDPTMVSLAQAYGVAANYGRYSPYVSHLISGLKDVLDDNPANVGKWAEAIVTGFQEEDHFDISLERKSA